MTLPVGAGAVYLPGLVLRVGSDGCLRGARMFFFWYGVAWWLVCGAVVQGRVAQLGSGSADF